MSMLGLLGARTKIFDAMTRRISRLRAPRSDRDIAYLEASGLFDREWYLKKYPDVAAAMVNPIEHYVLHGAGESRNPSPFFDTKYYMETYPDVAAAGINPFRHFCEFGEREGRNPSAASGREDRVSDKGPLKSSAVLGQVQADHSDAASESLGTPGVFDESFYLSCNPDVMNSGMTPFEHFLRYGAEEGRNPCAWFDSKYYLKRNPDVARAGVAPIKHFCLHGWRELRDPGPSFDIAHYWLNYMLPVGAQGNPLAYFGSFGEAQRHHPVPVGGRESLKSLAELALEALDAEDHAPETWEMLGLVLMRDSRWPAAETAFRAALTERWDSARLHSRLADVLEKQGKWWQAVDSWQAATSFSPNAPAEWWCRLGVSQERMNRYGDAASAYEKALALKPDQPKWQYFLGYAAERAGDKELSEAAYAKAVTLDARPVVKRFGIGVFHQARGYWPEAAAAYSKEIERSPLDAELHYKLGMAHDRCYRWRDALQAYSVAISLDPEGKPHWHSRYGFVLERLKRWEEAALAYATAVKLSGRNVPYWRYRQGYSLAMAGHHERACYAYIGMRADRVLDANEMLAPPEDRRESEIQNRAGYVAANVGLSSSSFSVESYLATFDPTDLIRDALTKNFAQAELHYRLGTYLERKMAWDDAARAYRRALDRSNSHQPKWFYLQGHALLRCGKFKEACDAFRQTYIIQRATGLSHDKLKNESKVTRLTTHYGEYLETLPVNDKVIFYDSHLGKFASCNPLAMFNYLVEHPVYREYLHVWAIDDPERVPVEIPPMTNVVIVQRHSDLFIRYLATAKYLISNSILPQYFVRRPEQKCLATWHGTPLKTLGKQQQYKFQEHKRAQRFFLQSTHIISPNPHTTGILLDSYDLRHMMTGMLAETGYPRLDLTLNVSDKRRSELRERLGVSGDRPVVLYAPTWRGTLETVSYEVARAKSDLKYLAEQHECDLIFRGHHLLESVLGSNEDLGCKVVPDSIDTNELLSIVDVLITDYSSILFDFLATGRPILLYAYDEEEYKRERGLYFSMDELPGDKCSDVESLSGRLAAVLKLGARDQKRILEAREKFNPHDDGMAAVRVSEFFFNDDTSHVVDSGPRGKIKLLMQGGGFKRNGITTSFLNLLKHIDRSLADITVAISPEVIEHDPECLELFSRVPQDVAVVARHGPMVMTWEERWLRRHYEKSRHELNDEQQMIIRRLYDREFKRVFGGANFDVVVAFSGYDHLWGSILNLSSGSMRRVMYMHNDMREEFTHRFPELMRMFRLYKVVDRLVGVCEESTSVNRRNLAGWLHIPEERFATSENVQDPGRIAELAALEVEPEDEGLFQNGPVFVNMGRLSVEKAQDKLIRAFARLCAEKGPMKLLILGVGPLQEYLENLIDELGMKNNIHLLGLRSNPYPYLRRSNCFVLSSDHEAKCMSLIEALIVGIPCVATDISGNRDIKYDFPEYFFDNSEGGLREGMLKYLRGTLPRPKFDTSKYQREALSQFESRVLGIGECKAEQMTKTGDADELTCTMNSPSG